MKKKIVALLFLFLCVPMMFVGCSTKNEKEIKKASKNINQYDINMTLSDHHLDITQTTTYINKSDDVLDKLYLHLYPQSFRRDAVNSPVGKLYTKKAYPNGESYCDFTISKILVNNNEHGVYYTGSDDDILQLSLDEGLYPDDKITLYFEYNMELPNVLHRFGYGDNTINIANFYPIMCVYENGEWILDGYNSNGDPFYSDLANYNVEITANSNYILATTGEILSKTSSNDNTIHKVCAKAVRDFACVLSTKFETVSEKVGDTTITYYYYDDPTPRDSLKAGVDAITTFSEKFGEYPYKTFSIVKTNFIHGGMEYPTLVYISDAVEDVDDYKNVIIHETAHQWWYGLVGSNAFRCGWIDEGLTDFSTALFYKYNDDYNISFDEVMKNTTNSYVTFVELYTRVLGDVDTSMLRRVDEYSTEPEYVYIAYVKGALLFNDLYEMLGEAKFLKVLQNYFDMYKFQNVSYQNFIGVVEIVTKTDMESYFNSWLNGEVVIKSIE